MEPATQKKPWRKIDSALVYERDGILRITAKPFDAFPDDFEDVATNGKPHRCELEGCGQEDVVADGELRLCPWEWRERSGFDHLNYI